MTTITLKSQCLRADETLKEAQRTPHSILKMSQSTFSFYTFHTCKWRGTIYE